MGTVIEIMLALFAVSLTGIALFVAGFGAVMWWKSYHGGKTNKTMWEIGKIVEATDDPLQGLCSDDRLHCYDTRL